MGESTESNKRESWLKQLDWVQKFSEGSKWYRLAARPKEYLTAILYRKLLYPLQKKATDTHRITFFGKNITIPLPVSTDIYLAGAKTHDSEIRLARFLIKELRPGQKYIDIGAHIGFFSMLAAELAGVEGKIISVEPSTGTYKYLQINTKSYPNVTAIQALVSQQSGSTSFFEFDTLYSEYNTIHPEQYKQDAWYAANAPLKTERESFTLRDLCNHYNLQPDIIKIDVEGAEYQVVSTLKDTSLCPVIIMEYILLDEKDMTHDLALNHLLKIGYELKRISTDGHLVPGENFREILHSTGLTSDNIVLVRS